MKAKILFPLAVATMFLGCSFFDDNPPVRKQPRQATKTMPAKSSIKGFIKDVSYKDSKYCYEIVASDVKNHKIFHFCYRSFTDFNQKEVYFDNLTFTNETFKKGIKGKRGRCFAP